jgi:hypothetical protein
MWKPIAFVSAAVLLGWWYGAADRTIAGDFTEQYEIAKRQGSKVDVCVHAGIVAAAYLQAKDEPSYAKWKATEKADCAAAGVRR